MAQIGGISSSSSMDSLRLPPALQKRFGHVIKSPEAGKFCASRSNHSLSRSDQTTGSRIYDKRVSCEEVCNGSTQRGAGLLLKGIPSAEKIRGMEIGDRFVSVKSIAHPCVVQHGYTQQDQASLTTGHVGNVSRSVGCVPSHTDQGYASALPMLSDRRGKVQVSGATLRTDARTMAVHRSSEATKKVGGKELSCALSVSGRLVEPKSRQGRTYTDHSKPGKTVYESRVTRQHEKVRISPDSINCLPRGEIRSPPGQGFPNRGETGRRERVSGKIASSRQSPVVIGRVITGQASSNLPHSAVGSFVHAPSTVPSTQGIEERAKSSVEGKSVGPIKGSPQVLVGPSDLVSGGTLSHPTTPVNCVHGRITGGVGCCLPECDVSGQVGPAFSSYQLAGAKGSADCTEDISVHSQRKVSVIPYRQFDSSSICQPSRGYPIQQTPRTDVGTRGTRKRTGVSGISKAYQRKPECVGRSGIKSRSGSTIRMEAIPRGFRMGMPKLSVGQTRLGAVCEPPQSSSTPVRVPVSRSSSMGDRCNGVRATVRSGTICVSTILSPAAVSAALTAVATVSPGDHSSVVSTGEVATGTTLPTQVSDVSLSRFPSAPDPTALGTQLPLSQVSESKDAVFGEERLRSLGYAEVVIKRLLLSHATSTKKQYKSQWVLFTSWATQLRATPCDPTTPSLKMLAEFLTWLFQERKLSIGSINNYRSAISFFWKRLYDFDVPPEDRILKELLRSFKRERPTSTKRSVSWDVKLVLEFFASARFADMDKVSDRELTLKTIFLIALASGKRRGELHALTREGVKEVHGEREGLLLHPSSSFISKTHIRTDGLGALKPVFIPKLVEVQGNNDLLCPVKCLNEYLTRSAQYRADSQKQLFISWQHNSVRDVKASTISNYIKQAVILAYELVDDQSLNGTQVVPHTVRHVATSLKAWRSFSLKDILEAGSWVSPNSFIAHYLTDFTTDTLSGLSSIGGFIAGGTQF